MNGLRIKQLEDKLGLKRSTIYNFIKEGKLPHPMKFGRASVWLESEIDSAIVILSKNRGQS